MKLCYVLPEYRADTDTHFFHLYEFVRTLSRAADVYLVVEKGGVPKDAFPNCTVVVALGGGLLPFRFLRMLAVLFRACTAGYRVFYTHYSYSGGLASGIVARICKGVSYYWNCGMPWLFGNQFGLRVVLFATHYLVTGTETMASLYSRHFGISPGKIRIIPNWIDAERFRIDANTRRESQKVLFVHHLSARKGADLIPDIALRIIRQLPSNSTLSFHVAGSGPLEESLRRELERGGISDRVTLHGAVPQYRIPQLFREASLFIMPSREEGFSHVLLESMAAGVPFVATDLGGVRDIIPVAAKDCLVKSEDTAAFAEACVRILTDRSFAKKLRAEGLRHIVRYNKEEVLRRFLGVMRGE